jgi:hypothetical protein
MTMATKLFDVRYFNPRKPHETTDPRGCYVATVGHIRAPALAGVLHDGDLVVADRAAIREALPHHWRKAFDRAQIWWSNEAPRASCTLYGSRDEVLARLYIVATD